MTSYRIAVFIPTKNEMGFIGKKLHFETQPIHDKQQAAAVFNLLAAQLDHNAYYVALFEETLAQREVNHTLTAAEMDVSSIRV